MKFKKLLTKVTALVLALCVLISNNLAAFASDYIGDAGGHGGSTGNAHDGTEWHGCKGVRLTVIDAGSETAPRKMCEPARSRMDRGIRADCVQFCTPCRS